MRNDLDFNLENVDCSDLYVVFYKTFIKSVVGASHALTVNFNYERSFHQTTMKRDGKEYAQVVLDFGTKYALVIDPFNVKVLVFDMATRDFSTPELEECLERFMNKRFPNSDYEKKRAEYFGESLNV